MSAFFNSFVSNVGMLLLYAAVSAVGVWLGVIARKKKDASQPAEETK